MAYDTKSPPSLLASGIGGATGLRHFAYRSAVDTVDTVLGAGYFTNARKLGMRVGDALSFVDPSNDRHHLQVSSIDDATGAGTVEFDVPVVTEEQAQGGEYNSGRMTPLRTRNTMESLDGKVYVLANTGAGLVDAITEAEDRGVAVQMVGDIDMGTTSVVLNANRVRLHGRRAALQWSGEPDDGYCLKVMGIADTGGADADYYNNFRRVDTIIDGIAFKGGASAAANFAGVALQLGDGVAVAANRLSLAEFANIAISGFDTMIDMTDGVWSVSFRNGKWQWGKITTPNPDLGSVIDFGERINFENIFLADNVTLELRKGGFFLDRCSIDNTLLDIYGDAQVSTSQCHWERPGDSGTDTLYAHLHGANSKLSVQMPHFLQNTAVRNDAMFKVDPENTMGLVLDDLSYAQEGNYNDPNAVGALNDHRAFVQSGSGRVLASKFNPLAFSNNVFFLAGDYQQRCANPGFEDADLDPWVQAGSGAFSQDTTGLRTARRITQTTKCLKMVASAAGNCSTSQKVPARPGEYSVAGFWRDADFSAGVGSRTITMRALDKAGNVLATNSDSGTTTIADWEYAAVAVLCPPKTYEVEFVMDCVRSSGTSVELRVDDILWNII